MVNVLWVGAYTASFLQAAAALALLAESHQAAAGGCIHTQVLADLGHVDCVIYKATRRRAAVVWVGMRITEYGTRDAVV